MEPVTHVLTGACLARAGLNRRVAYATAGMAIAAEFPDIDTLWSLRGPVSGFEHHRGITHTFLGIPFEAAFLLLGFLLYHRWRSSRKSSAFISLSAGSTVRTKAEAPIRWGLLYLLLIFALLTHILLDYTNNYGVRPFFPFNGHWYAGSIVFIFDPVLFLLLAVGLLLPVLFGLIGREVGARRERFRGRGWARAALVGVLLLWSLRWVEHSRAVVLAQAQTLRAPGVLTSPPASGAAGTAGSSQDQASPEPAPSIAPADSRPLLMAERSLASPDPLSVFRWYTVTDFGPAYRLGVADTNLGTSVPGGLFVKPLPGPSLLAAERSRLGQIYLDWSPMPILTLSRTGSETSDAVQSFDPGSTAVLFTDPRFMGDLPLLHSRNHPALTGEVVLAPGGRVLAQGMDGRLGG